MSDAGPGELETLEARVRALLGAGDGEGAATAAIRALGPQILRYLRAVLREEADARDAFSQFAENLWKGLPRFRGEAGLRTWAYRIAWDAALNLRDEAWRRRARPFATGEASALAEEVRTGTAIRVERQRDALASLRASLSAEDQSLLTLRLDQQLSWAEIAGVVAAEGSAPTPDAVSKRFERLKERLARLAREQGLLD
ncbi:MAG TPA: sigma-70 family RNA polymerase sigma factor [Anaeromyxobacteraceae bacterium]|nr:sigma-70 family RNA polymerase sigma factor [Anaeromyxobacteraceae bacterium]